MCILNIVRAISETLSLKIGFSKENSYYSMKRLKKTFIFAFKQIN